MPKSLSTSERNSVELPVLRWAAKAGLLAFKLNLQGNCGWPDRMYLFHSPFLAFLEFKRLGKGPDPLQEIRIAELQRRGYAAGCFDNVGDAIQFLEDKLREQTAMSPLRGG